MCLVSGDSLHQLWNTGKGRHGNLEEYEVWVLHSGVCAITSSWLRHCVTRFVIPNVLVEGTAFIFQEKLTQKRSETSQKIRILTVQEGTTFQLVHSVISLVLASFSHRLLCAVQLKTSGGHRKKHILHVTSDISFMSLRITKMWKSVHRLQSLKRKFSMFQLLFPSLLLLNIYGGM